MFEPGELILYQNGDRNEIGIVKEKAYNLEEKYYVYYHLGDTVALTDARDMQKIINSDFVPKMIEKFK